MKAIILAAGRGSRMEEGTRDIPKCMMRLGGRTLLERCLESLAAAGVALSDTGIVTGYRSEVIEVPGARFFHNADWANTNMFVSLTMAREWLVSEPCIVLYSDIVFSPNAVTALLRDDSDIALTYYTGFLDLWQKRFENPLDDMETFHLSGDRLTEIGQRPDSVSDVQGQYMGLLRFTPRGWARVEDAIARPMPKPVGKLDMTTLLSHLLSLGVPVKALRTDDLWLECDSLSDVRLYEKEYAAQL